MSNGEPTLDELLNFALDAAWQAGRVTLGYFQTGTQVERKADNTPVTIADREAAATGTAARRMFQTLPISRTPSCWPATWTPSPASAGNAAFNV